MMDILKTYREKIIKVSSLFLTMALMPTAILMVSNESKRESAKVQNIVDEVKFKDLSNNKEFSMSENEFLEKLSNSNTKLPPSILMACEGSKEP